MSTLFRWTDVFFPWFTLITVAVGLAALALRGRSQDGSPLPVAGRVICWILVSLSLAGIPAYYLIRNAGRPWCPHGSFENYTHFPVHKTGQTAGGIPVDTGAAPGADVSALDARFAAIESCLQKISAELKAQGRPTKAELQSWQCGERTIRTTIPRSCLIVKVMPALHSPCSSWEFLDAPAPPAGCREKGLEPTPECPCRWRTVIQDDMTIITPPALYLWEVVRWTTGCWNSWASPFSVCMML